MVFLLVPVDTIPADEPPLSIPDVEMVCESAVGCIRLVRLELENSEIRGRAIVTLGALKEKQAVPDLISIVQGHRYGDHVYHYNDAPDSLLVVTAIRALGTIGDRRAIPALIEFIQKEAYIQFRVLAAETIKMIGVDREDIPRVLDLLNDPHTSIRYVIFEAIRFADDPVSKRYTQRFVSYIPRADMIEDSVTPLPNTRSLGVPIYQKGRYVFSASASEGWIMREEPVSLGKSRWVHTFLTQEPLDEVVKFYEAALNRQAKTQQEIERDYVYTGATYSDTTFIKEGYGFIIKKSDRPVLRNPVVVVSIFRDDILDGTAVTIYAPK